MRHGAAPNDRTGVEWSSAFGAARLQAGPYSGLGRTLGLLIVADGFRSRGTPSSGARARSRRIEDRSGCVMTVFLDGVRVQPPPRAGLLVDEQINTLIQPTSVAGIEVYTREAGAPAEYPPIPGSCGVVLIWSR